MSAEVGVLIGVALAALAVFFVTRPFRERTFESGRDEIRLDDLAAQREAAYEVLRDLDNDFQTGKIAEDDYRPLRVQALAHAAEIIAQLDAYEKQRADGRQQPTDTWQPLPLSKRTRRARPIPTQADAFCPQCGMRHAPDDAFCRKCGAPLNGADLAGLTDTQSLERHD